MGQKFWGRLPRLSKRTYIVAALVIVVAGAAGAYWHFSNQARLASRHDIGGTLATADMLKTATRLRDSFGLTNEVFNSKKNSSQYLEYLHRFQKDCTDIDRYYKSAKTEDETSSITQYLAKSDAACTELVKLSREGITITESILPLLQIDAHLKRYQTLPFISGQIRKSHEEKVHSALDQLPDKLAHIEFKTETKEYLRQLDASMKANSGLTYFSALDTFQHNAYGERQRYWNNDGDLGNLIRALETYLTRYCKILPEEDSNLPACKNRL